MEVMQFNPRSREERRRKAETGYKPCQYFNHAPAKATGSSDKPMILTTFHPHAPAKGDVHRVPLEHPGDFNPRSREGDGKAGA